MTKSLSVLHVGMLAMAVVFGGMVSSAHAQPGNFLGGGNLLSGGQDEISLEPELKIRLTPDNAKVGDTVTAEIQVKLNEKAYVYSQNPNIGAETKIRIEHTTGLTPLSGKFQPNRKPKEVVEPLFDNAKLEKFYGGVTWTRQYRVEAANARLVGTLTFQVCDEATCNPFEEKIDLSLQAGSGTAKPKMSIDLASDANTQIPDSVPVPPSKPTSQKKMGGIQPLEQVFGKVIASQKLLPEREFGEQTEPVTLTLRLVEAQPAANGAATVVVSVAATVTDHWHMYALDQDPKMFALPTEISLETPGGWKAIDTTFRPVENPEVTTPLEDVIQLVHHDQVTWQQRFEVADSAALSKSVTGAIRYQLCKEGTCLPPNTVEFTLKPGEVAEGTQLVASSEASSGSGPVEETLPLQEQGLIPFLLTGIVFGYLALLTPCVFPMIPITISFFLKQAEKEHHNPVGMATLYCFGIVATFTLIGVMAAALFGSAGLNTFANNVWFNIFLAGVLIFFGFNMLGLFEIRVPSWLLTWSSGKERSGGAIGVLFMSFTFTLVSFTCTFAFVGFLLPMAARGNYYWPILGMLAFSTAFASPFFFLALFPSFLKKMPKSGGWMNNVKVVCGLVELGAAFKFLSVADISWFSTPYVFDYPLVMTSWMVIAIITGLYLLGMFKLPHDSAADHIGVVRLGFALTFFGFAAYLSSGIYGRTPPNGIIWQQIVAFAPPTYETKQDVDLGPAVEHDELLYALDVNQAIQHAKAKNQPLFFDFTGTNCVNCRFMEVNVFPKEENRELLEKFVRVQLYTDTIPDMTDAEKVGALLDTNRELQSEWFNDATLPAYAVVTPDGQTILSQYKGSERSQGQFTRFLETGYNEWERMKTAQASDSVRR